MDEIFDRPDGFEWGPDHHWTTHPWIAPTIAGIGLGLLIVAALRFFS